MYDAYLKYYMHIQEPEKLEDEDWCENVMNLHFIRTSEKESSKIE